MADAEPPSGPCPSCGTQRVGRYCHACGEKRLEPAHDHSLRWIGEQVLEGLLHLDTKLLRTFGALLLRPGQLTRDCLDGRRVRTLAPLPVFFVTSVLFYLCFDRAYASDVATLAHIHANGGWIGNLLHYDIEGVLTAKAAIGGTSYEALAERVRDRAGQESKLFLGLLLPFFAAAFHLLFRRREPRFVPHLVAAVHQFSLFLLVDLGFLGICRLLGMRQISDLGFLPLLAIYAVHLLFGLRRIYRTSLAEAAWKAVALVGWLAALVIVYRQLVTIVTAARI